MIHLITGPLTVTICLMTILHMYQSTLLQSRDCLMQKGTQYSTAHMINFEQRRK